MVQTRTNNKLIWTGILKECGLNHYSTGVYHHYLIVYMYNSMGFTIIILWFTWDESATELVTNNESICSISLHKLWFNTPSLCRYSYKSTAYIHPHTTENSQNLSAIIHCITNEGTVLFKLSQSCVGTTNIILSTFLSLDALEMAFAYACGTNKFYQWFY